MKSDLEFAHHLDPQMESLFLRHSRIALQFSGGKDSTACLYLLRPWLERITVYWVNAGDEFPETIKVVEGCRSWIPHFVEVKSDSLAWREEHGLPSDLIPAGQNSIGRQVQHPAPRLKISDPYVCCAINYMLPLDLRMKEDRTTCIIRGQKLADRRRGPLKSGESSDGFEFFFPIENWTDMQVMLYLQRVGAPIHECYQHGLDGVNCLTCTAWWEDSQHKYRAAAHPQVQESVDEAVADLVKPIINKLNVFFVE